MDQQLTQWINELAGVSPALDAAMIAITGYGVPLLVLMVVLQWWSGHERYRVRHTCVAAGLAFLIGLGLNQIVLLLIHRVRPYDAGVSHLIIDRSADWSFPSDHATAAFAIATTFLLHRFSGRGSALLLGAVAVCLSRIYVGTHYVTDVLGGTATGAAAAVAVRLFYREGSRIDRLVTEIL